MSFYTTRSKGDRPVPAPAKDSEPGVTLCPPGFQPGAPVPLLSSVLTQFGVRMVLAGLSPPGEWEAVQWGQLWDSCLRDSHLWVQFCRQWGGQERPFCRSSLQGRGRSWGWNGACPGAPLQALAWPSPALGKKGGCPSSLGGPGSGMGVGLSESESMAAHSSWMLP